MKKILFALVLSGLFVHSSAQTVIWEENFNSATALPTGWTQTSLASDGGWSVDTGAGLSSQSFTIAGANGKILGTNDDDCDCDKSNDFVRLPVFDLSATVTPYLLFDRFYFAGAYEGITESLHLEVSEDGGLTWAVLSTVTGAGGWNPTAINLTPYAGQNDIMIGFKYNDGGGWLFGAGLDNFQLIEPDLSIVDATAAGAGIGVFVDAVPSLVGGYTKYLTGEQVTPFFTVSNEAFTQITSYDVTYILNGGTPVTESVTDVDIGYGESLQYGFDTPATIGSGANSFTFSISNVNGGGETVTNNNSGGVASITGIVPNPNRVVVAEEGTGTWCGWCPRGTVFMDYLTAKYPDNFVGIAVHNGDPMTNTTYDTAMGNNISGYPSGLVDRVSFAGSDEVDPSDFEKAMFERITQDPGVNISTAVSFNGNVAFITSNLDFTANLNGNYRIAVVIMEDGVTGTGAAWNQTNYYAGGGAGPMGGYESLGAAVPASQMVYDHVARAIVGGWAGASGSVPSANAAGSSHSYTTNYTVPASYNMENLKAITLLIKQTGDEIINAGVSEGFSVGVQDLVESSFGVSVYPNPANDQTNIKINTMYAGDVVVRITDAAGREVANRTYQNMMGENFIPIATSNFDSGYYTVSVFVNGESIQKSLLVTK